MRRLWAQLAALGVGRIILTNAERVERHYFDTHVLTPECYRPLLIEGLQQARDTRLPASPSTGSSRCWSRTNSTGCSDGVRLVADPDATTPAMSVSREQAAERVLLAVGPEGGWNAFEIALLAAHGFMTIMGPRTLSHRHRVYRAPRARARRAETGVAAGFSRPATFG